MFWKNNWTPLEGGEPSRTGPIMRPFDDLDGTAMRMTVRPNSEHVRDGYHWTLERTEGCFGWELIAEQGREHCVFSSKGKAIECAEMRAKRYVKR